MENTLKASFPWYDAYGKQNRFLKHCEGDDCDFKLITHRRSLLPFLLQRPTSGAIIKDFVIRPYNIEPYPNMIPSADAKFDQVGSWAILDWSIANGKATADTQLLGTMKQVGLLTVGKRYTIQICVDSVIPGGAGPVGFKIYNGATLVTTITARGVYAIPILAVHANITVETLSPNATDVIVIEEFFIKEQFSVNVSDITLNPFQLGIKTFDSFDYFAYCGESLLDKEDIEVVMNCGCYYAIINDGDNQYFSEVFHVKDFFTNKSPYLKLQWQNECDIQDIIYQPIDGCQFMNILWLDPLQQGVLNTPEYPFDEEGDNNENKEFIATLQVWQKKQSLIIPFAPEFIVDSLTAMKMHDVIFITEPVSEHELFNYAAKEIENVEFKVEWDETKGCTASVNLSFTMDKNIADTGCCKNNELVCIEECYTDIRYGSPLAPAPTINEYMYCDTFPPCIVFGLFQYDGTIWVLVPDVEIGCVIKPIGTTRYLYWDGTNWLDLPVLNSVSVNANAELEFDINPFPGLFNAIEYSLSPYAVWQQLIGGTVDTVSTNIIKKILVSLAGLPTCVEIKFRVDAFNWNCPENVQLSNDVTYVIEGPGC